MLPYERLVLIGTAEAIKSRMLAKIRALEEMSGHEVADEAVPENADKYPEHNMFGTLPAYAFYCRHARNLALRNIHTEFVSPEQRPAVVNADVR